MDVWQRISDNIAMGAIRLAYRIGGVPSHRYPVTDSKDVQRQTPMAGTIEGGKRAAATNKARYGADYYARIGRLGGARGRTGGFYANRELARVAGAKGGHISRRGPKGEGKTKNE